MSISRSLQAPSRIARHGRGTAQARRAVLLCITGFVFSVCGVEAAECLAIDGARSDVRFAATQAGMTLRGRFETAGGEICVSGAMLESVNAWVETASVKTVAPDADDALRSDVFLAVRQHPRASFESDDIERDGDGWIAHGVLQIKGVGKPFDLPLVLEKTAAGYRLSGRTTLLRLDFNVGTGEWAATDSLENEVAVEFAVVTE